MDIKSNTELDYGYLRDGNFIAEKDGIELVFSVTVDIDYKVYRPDYDSQPEYEVKKSYISAILKEAWKGDYPVILSSKKTIKLEQELEAQLKKLYID